MGAGVPAVPLTARGRVEARAAARFVPWVAALVLACLHPAPAWAHTGAPLGPGGLAGAWFQDPWALAAIGAASWLYARGCGRLWARAGAGRGIPRWRFRCYAAGIAALFAALATPLDPLGGSLFSAHMVQHELLMVLGAPLLVLGTPMLAFLWTLPRERRLRLARWVRKPPVRGVWRALTHPFVAWGLHALAIWVWHAPRLYEATLRSDLVHALQHLSFFGTALLFWWPLLHPSPHRRLGHGLAVMYLFTTAVHGSALGAFLSLSSRPWYPAYAPGTALWGITLLEDQQLGGLLMWIPFGAVYTVAALALLGHWLVCQEAGALQPRPVPPARL